MTAETRGEFPAIFLPTRLFRVIDLYIVIHIDVHSLPPFTKVIPNKQITGENKIYKTMLNIDVGGAVLG